MQQSMQCTGKARARRSIRGSCLRWLAAACLALGAVAPAWAACPATVNLNVASGGSVAIDCAHDWGFLEVDQATSHTTTYGHVSVIPGQVYAPEYVNDSGPGQTDDFYLTDGETGGFIGDPAHQVHIIVTIGAATSTLAISPTTLPNPAVAVAYSQQLSTTGGTAPYTYSITGGSLPPGLSLSSSGLISGTSTGADTYSFTVHVQDSAGTPATLDKNYSVVIPAPTLDLSPDNPPSGAINLPYSQQFSVSGGTAPYTYSIEAGLGILPPGLTLSSSGLLSGTPTATGSYTFSLKYQDSTTFSGGGQAFKAQNVTLVIANATVPGAPTIGTATAGNAQATVSFTAPASNGGAAITGYTVTSSPGGFTGTGSASPITVTGLTNGTAYTFTVTATNAVGTGAASAASNSVTPKGTQTITFNNPGTQNFGTAPTLTASASSGLAPTFSSATTGVCTVTSAGALTFVAAGTCTINADQAGNGTFQAAPTVSQSFTIAAIVPAAPTIGTATAGDAQAAVSFTAPANTGGAAITGYTVTSNPGGFTASGSASPISVTGLANGTAYTFTVTATNSAGTGSASAASNSVTPKGVQTITFANPGTQNFGTSPTLTATASSSLAPTFSSATTGVCTVTSGGALTFVAAGTCTIDADQAGNGAFQAAPTVSQSFTVAAIVPTTPTIGTATAGNAQAAVTFTAPASDGGSVITGYTVTSSPGGITATGSASPISVTGLTNGTAYTFTVAATNSAGTGSASGASNSVTPMGTQTISGFIANPSSPVFSPNGTFSVAATASSGLPVAFGIDAGSASVCSIAGSTVTMLSAGTCSITADQAGNASYLPASQQTLAVIITAPPVPVANAVSATVAYGSSANPITLNITGGAADSVAVGTAATHGTASASGTSITYTPTAGFAGSDSFTYTATNTSGTSAPATVTITVSVPTLTLTPASGTLSLAYATAYSQAFTASGGAAPYSYVLSGTLPAGVSFDSATGMLSGTPTQPGNFPVSVTATDSSTGIAAPFSITQSYTLQVATPTVTLAPASLPTDAVGAAYPATSISASGGVAPYAYAVTAGALPPGLTLAPTGQLSGTPTAAGSFPFTVTATDAHGQAGSLAYTLGIGAPTIVLAPATLPNATAETAYAQTISASGGTAPYAYSIGSGSLPAGVTLSNSTGALTGTPTVSGDFTFTVDVTDSSTGTGAPFASTQSYTLHVLAPTVVVTPATMPAATSGTAYPSTTISASGGVAPYSYALSGTLPAGLSFNAGTATFTGTPTETGSFAITVTATDTHGFAGSANYTLAVATATLDLSPGSLPNATAETAYSQTLTASGGVAPYSYALVSGALPAGLSFDPGTASISGTPTVGGTFNIGIKVTDASTGSGAPASLTKTYALVVVAPVITIAPASLPAGQQAEAYSQTLSASGGSGSYSYAVTAGALPAGLSLSGTGALSGTPTVSGSFNFTVAATDGLDFGGAQAYTLVVDVAKPIASDDTASTSANQAATIAVTGNDSGQITSIAVDTAPAHGTATVNALNVVYTPASNFFGTDTLTYTATGPGGTSAPATVTVTVTPLAVPTAVAQAATTLAGKAVTIHATQGASGGPFTAVTLASQPASGTAVVTGQDIVYTPTIDASGPVSFTYTLSNRFGVSQPATITVQVHPVPQVVAQTVDALAGTTVQVELTRQARGGPFTGADLISVSPASAGSGTIVKNGDGYRLDFATAATYSGAVQISFTLSNAYATSEPGVITVNVTARPDPSKDADVLGVLGAQVDATRRFAIGQIDNFQRRLENLHGNGNLSAFSNGLSFQSGGGLRAQRTLADRNNGQLFGDELQRRYLVQPDNALPVADNGAPGGRSPDALAFWAGGAVNFGTQRLGGSSNGVDFSTAGISVGADKRLSPELALGAGLGYGHDASDIGHDGSRSTANSYNAATYGSFHPSESTYVDGLVGYQWLSFDARRHITANGNQVFGSRDGKQWFGSFSAGYEHRDEHMLLSPYGRLDIASARLDAYTEHGDALYSLHYDEQTVKTTTGSVGLRMNYPVKRDFGMLAPQLRVEYQHDFQGDSTATMRYADLLSGPLYRATVGGQSRNHTLLGVGLQLQTWRGLMFRVEYQNLFDDSSRNNQSILLGLEAPFNP